MWCALVDRDSVQGNLTLIRPCLQVPGGFALWIIVYWICKGEVAFSTLFYYWSICCCSVTLLCLALCDPMDCSKTGFSVLHYFPELAQTHVHWVDDAIQPSHPLSAPFPAFSLSQHQGLFQWVVSSHQLARVLELQLQSFQWLFRTDFL